MVKRITRGVRDEVVRLCLQGYSGEEIAEKVGIPAEKVSKILEDLIVAQIRSSGITVPLAIEAIRIAEVLKKMEKVGKSEEIGILPEKIIESAYKLLRLKEETGLDYEELLRTCESLQGKKAELEKEIEKLLENKKGLENSIKSLMEEEKALKERLENMRKEYELLNALFAIVTSKDLVH